MFHGHFNLQASLRPVWSVLLSPIYKGRSPESVSGLHKVTQLVSSREGIKAINYPTSVPVFPPILYWWISLNWKVWDRQEYNSLNCPTVKDFKIHNTSGGHNYDPFSPVKYAIMILWIMTVFWVLITCLMLCWTFTLQPYLIPTTVLYAKTCNPHVQLRNARFSKVRYLDQRHIASNGQDLNLDPCWLWVLYFFFTRYKLSDVFESVVSYKGN